MKKQGIVTLSALLLMAALICAFPRLTQKTPARETGVRVLRVWVLEEEKAVTAWLKKRAAAYEKQEKCRVYLRAASAREAEDALQGKADAVTPDVLVTPGMDSLLALRGYGLFVRDGEAEVTPPVPTGALFSRPTPEPRETRTPVREPDRAALGPVLCPAALVQAVPGAVLSEDPFAALIAGKANAAVLTAGQAGRLPFGCAGYPLENGFLPVTAQGFTGEGRAFVSFLRGRASQLALGEAGLYSFLPELRLYDESQPLRSMIEEGARNYTVSSPEPVSTTLNSSRWVPSSASM